MVLNLEEDNVGVVLLGDSSDVMEGDTVKRTGKLVPSRLETACVAVWSIRLECLSMVKETIEGETFEMPLERKAPGVIYREPVSEPLQTGIVRRLIQ